MKSKLAPVIIFTYNRLDTLTVVIENLQNNKLAKDTELFIFSDYAKKAADVNSIEQVRNFLEQIKGFKSIKIIKRKTNYGLAKNIIEGVTEIINRYEKVIVLEDDLLTSKNFLSYMNQALDFYEEDKNIFAISGYTGDLASLKHLNDEGYLSYRPCSWGWGTWKEEWEKNDWDAKIKIYIDESATNKLQKNRSWENYIKHLWSIKKNIWLSNQMDVRKVR